MAGGDNVIAPKFRVNGNGNCAGTISGGNAGGHTLFRLDGDGKSGFVPRAVCLAHQRNAEFFHPALGQRQTNKPARVLGHEVDGIRRGELRRDHKVALVLAVLVIDQDKNPSSARFLDDLSGGGDIIMQSRCFQRRFQAVHRALSFSAAVAAV